MVLNIKKTDGINKQYASIDAEIKKIGVLKIISVEANSSKARLMGDFSNVEVDHFVRETKDEVTVEATIIEKSFNKVVINAGPAAYFGIEYNCPNPVRDVKIKNSIISNNYPSVYEPDFHAGGALMISGHFNIPGNYNAQLINCEISENYCNFYNPQTDMGGTSGLYLKDMVLVDVVNTTFGDNTLSHNTGCTTSVYNTELNLYNSILYNNVGYSINLWEYALVVRFSRVVYTFWIKILYQFLNWS